MPGALSGIVQGIEAGARIRQTGEGLALDKFALEQRASEKDYERNRQKAIDELAVAKENIGAVANRFRTPEVQAAAAYLKASGERPTDPAEAKKYDDAAALIEDIHGEAQKWSETQRSAQDRLIGHEMDAVKRTAAKTTAAIASNSLDPRDVSPQDLDATILARTGLPAQYFAVNPETGQSQAGMHREAIQQAVQTDDWSNPVARDALTSLLPQLQSSMGHELPGGGVTAGTKVIGVDVNPADHRRVLLRLGHVVIGPDGKPSMQAEPADAPPLNVPIDQLIKQEVRLQKIADLTQHPDMQRKLQWAIENKQTAYDRINQLLLGAGAAKPEKPELVSVPRGARVFEKDPVTGKLGAQPVAEGGSMRLSTAEQREALADQLQEDNPSMSREEAMKRAAAAVKGETGPKDPNLRASEQTNELLSDMRRSKMAESTMKAVTRDLIKERGLNAKLDGEGNVVYATDVYDKKNTLIHQKGEVVNDPDLDAMLSAASEKLDENPKKLPTKTDLVKHAKEALKAKQAEDAKARPRRTVGNAELELRDGKWVRVR